MSWTTPKVWVAGATLTSAELNTYLRDNSNMGVTARPYCMLALNGAQSCADGAQINPSWSDVNDSFGMHSGTSAQIYVQTGQAGLWLVCSSMGWATNNASGRRSMSIWHNSSVKMSRLSAPGSGQWDGIAQYVALANVGDYFEATIFQGGSGVTMTTWATGWFAAVWRGAI